MGSSRSLLIDQEDPLLPAALEEDRHPQEEEEHGRTVGIETPEQRLPIAHPPTELLLGLLLRLVPHRELDGPLRRPLVLQRQEIVLLAQPIEKVLAEQLGATDLPARRLSQ